MFVMEGAIVLAGRGKEGYFEVDVQLLQLSKTDWKNLCNSSSLS